MLILASLAVPWPAPTKPRVIHPTEAAVLTADSWCPGRADLSLDELLQSAGLEWAQPRQPHSEETARCDLTAQKWLFVVSPGGRTGSTTVLDMVNAHPAFDLAGENDGQLLAAMELWHKAAEHINSPNGGTGDAWGRGAVDPYNLLCDLAYWFEDVTRSKLRQNLTIESLRDHSQSLRSKVPTGSSSSGKHRTVLGFKEIRWGTDDTSLRFLNALFPCHRLIFSYRTGVWSSRFNNQEKARRKAENWKAYSQSQPAWHHRWITLKSNGFAIQAFNGMLEWFGEPSDGCRFESIETANTDGFNNGGDQSRLLRASKCRLHV